MVTDELEQIISNLNIDDINLDLNHTDTEANKKAFSALTFLSFAVPRPDPAPGLRLSTNIPYLAVRLQDYR